MEALSFRAIFYFRCLEVFAQKRISSGSIINDPWIILGSSRIGYPNTSDKRKSIDQQQVLSKMKVKLSLAHNPETILQHIKVGI